MNASPTLYETGLRLASLTVLRGVRSDPVVAALYALATSGDQPPAIRVERYAAFAALLLEAGGNWSEYLLELALCDDNPYARKVAANKARPGLMGQVLQRLSGSDPSFALLEQALQLDLAALRTVSALTSEAVAAELDCGLPLAGWKTVGLDFAGQYAQHMERIHTTGYGVFARYTAFRVCEGALVPVQHPDPVRMASLTGYTAERKQVEENTLALLDGKPAANVLLYGDSGTGKSTCVKALANAYAERGLRLIELPASELHYLPVLTDQLNGNPLKFILFVDDLSFAQDGADFSALKAVLEGSVAARCANMVIYATSNRRHLVRERFSDREGDDIHVRDTLEELGSLSERFGLTVTFLRPGRELYLDIVRRYCTRFGIPVDDDIGYQAERFAIARGGRSARVARQFVEGLAAKTSQEKGDSHASEQ